MKKLEDITSLLDGSDGYTPEIEPLLLLEDVPFTQRDDVAQYPFPADMHALQRMFTWGEQSLQEVFAALVIHSLEERDEEDNYVRQQVDLTKALGITTTTIAQPPEETSKEIINAMEEALRPLLFRKGVRLDDGVASWIRKQ